MPRVIAQYIDASSRARCRRLRLLPHDDAALAAIQQRWYQIRPQDKPRGDAPAQRSKGAKGEHGFAAPEEFKQLIVGLLNLGRPRARGQEGYDWNLYNMTATVFMRCELCDQWLHGPVQRRSGGLLQNILTSSTLPQRRTWPSTVAVCSVRHRSPYWPWRDPAD